MTKWSTGVAMTEWSTGVAMTKWYESEIYCVCFSCYQDLLFTTVVCYGYLRTKSISKNENNTNNLYHIAKNSF